MSATTPELQIQTQAVPRPAAFEGALGIGVAMLAAIFIVVRPGSQFAPYSGESAFAGIVVFMLALFVVLKAFVASTPIVFPRALAIALIAWLALVGISLVHSPNLGTGIPVAGDAGLFVLLLLCGYCIARLEPQLVSLLTRATIAMSAVEAFAGIWQYYIDLPQMRVELAKGSVALPQDLQTGLGAARIAGNLVYGTFANPNSLAGYLLVGIFLLLGLLWSDPRTAASANKRLTPGTIGAGLVLLLMLAGLGFTGSKGGIFAAVAGAWFFGAQVVGNSNPALKKKLFVLTAAGVGTAVLLLMLGCAGYLGPKPFGLSMEVRLDYWRSAFAMWKSHPLGGVGLGGFGDHYSFFKMPMGEEVKDAHNDYVQFAAEMGVLAPLLYALVWWFTLAPKTNPAPASRESEENTERSKLLEMCVIVGGVLAFVLMDGGFQWFDSGDALRLLQGHVEKTVMIAAFHTFALPFMFACVILVLRPKFELANWSIGARAAVGAVLVHQLVDFDFRSPATMSSIFVIGGMLASFQTGPDAAPPAKFNRPAVAMALLALVLFPVLALIPMRSSSPRANAADLEGDVQDLTRLMATANADSPELQRVQQMRMDIFDYRKQARDAAPFDAETWVELGLAYDLLPLSHETAAHRKAAQECFEKAADLRPLSPVPKLMLGQFFSRHAFQELEARDAQSDADFALAQQAFAAAAERYPLHPGFRLWEGDSALMAGNISAAANAYSSAFETDMLIDDTSVRISAIFTDPRPGAFARHGYDIVILKTIDRSLADEKSAPKLYEKGRYGLLVRRMVALAWLLHEHKRKPLLNDKDLERTQRELSGTTDRLVNSGEDAAARAHAALFRALAFRLTEDKFDEKKMSPAAQSAWTDAATLQQKSIDAGRPGTPQRTFQAILNLYGPK
jgi:O-antigen ligase